MPTRPSSIGSGGKCRARRRGVALRSPTAGAAALVRVGIGFVAGSLLLGPAAADEGWMSHLQRQILTERDCRIEHVVSVREFELAGKQALEGRVRCFDGREFDFSREQKHLPFRILLCQPAVC